MTKISSKTVKGLHAAIDELVAASPETATALAVILENLMNSETAIEVPARRKGGKPSTTSADLDDDDLDEGDDNDDLDDGDDDDLDEKPVKRGRGRPAASTSKPKGRPAKQPEPEEDEDDANGEEIDLDDLEAETIKDAFENFEPSETHERASGGIRELTAAIDGFGFDVPRIVKKAKASTPAEKKEVLSSFLSRIHFTIDAINAFDLESIIAAVDEINGEEGYAPKGRGAAKELAAATELFRVAVFGPDEE